jgi:hypothetical protein
MTKYLKCPIKKTFIFSVFLSILFLCVEGLSSPVKAASVSWDGGGDAVSWSDGLNWSGDVVPTDADDVLIDSDVTVDLGSATTVNSLVLGNSGGTTTVVLNFSYDSVGTSSPLIIDSGNLVVYSGGTITHSPGTSVVVGTVNIDVQTGDLIVNAGGSIDVTGKGYYRNNGPGMGSYEAGSGYGGYGGTSPAGLTGGPAYGSIDNPVHLGSGGYNSSRGGDGGGLIKLVIANDLIVNGSIYANGTAGGTSSLSAGSGASGGSINITVSNLWSGSGEIASKGGSGGTYLHAAAGGGGGRISITGYISKTFSGNLSAIGGDGPANYNGSSIPTDGGAGTLFLQPNGESPDIIIDNSGNVDLDSGGITPISYTSVVDVVEMVNYSYVQFDSLFSATNIISTSNSYVTFNGNISTTNLEISGNSKVFINSIFNISQLLDLDSGYLRVGSEADIDYSTFNFVNAELADAGGSFPYMENSTLNIASGNIVNGDYPRTYSSGLIEGTLSHSPNTDTIVNKMEYIFTGDLTVSSGGSIDVSGKGYSGGNGPGTGALGQNYDGAGGGAHGGNGGNGESGFLGGIAYDSSINPEDFGSGGGNSSGIVGGSGGGLINLDIGGTLNLQGSIIANGGNGTTRWGYYSSGGAGGGSINISTNILTGNGSFEANGGTAFPSISDKAYGGGGGGGIIYVLYDESNFVGTTSVSGGVGGNNGFVGIATLQASNQTPIANESDLANTSNLYAGLSYSIESVYSDLDGQDDLSKLYLLIQNPDGDDIEIRANYSSVDLTDQIPDLLSGSSYVDNLKYSIYPSYGTENEIKIIWTFDIGWNWTTSSSIEYGVKASDSSEATSLYSMTMDSYIYKNTLEFNQAGSLLVTDDSDNPITAESWMLPDFSINWSGYKVVYTDETDVYPNISDYNIKLEDGTGRFWLDSGTYGLDFEITTDTLSNTTDENIYTLSIVDIPTGGTSSDVKTFIVKVDADNPVITSLDSSSHPIETTWYSTNILDILWQTADSDSGIDSTYRYLSENPNETVSTIENNGTLTSLTNWTSDVLSDGFYYFYLLVKDLVGNSVIENRTVKIDSSVPDIVEVTGAYKNQWQNINSGPLISWTDPLSLSDDIFYITTDGSIPSASNFRYATNQNSYNLPSLGEGEFDVKVRSRNGANSYSITRSFAIKYDSTPTAAITNISAIVSSNNRISLNWENPTDSDFSKTVVIRKVGSIPGNIGDGTKVYEGSSKNYTSSTLASSTKYYYAFWGYDEVGNVSNRASISVTTLDLNPTAAVTNFEIDPISENEILLTWQNPQETDFAKVKLYRGEDLLYDGNGQTYTDTLTVEGDYQYRIYAYDSSNNISDPKTLNYEFLPVEEVVIVKEDSDTETISEGDKSQIVQGESVEIQIPVSKIFGNLEIKDDDKVVLKVNDLEYEMELSDDKKYFTTKFTAPDVKGEHRISALAIREDQILGQFNVDIEVVDSNQVLTTDKNINTNTTWLIIAGIILLFVVIGGMIIYKKKH